MNKAQAPWGGQQEAGGVQKLPKGFSWFNSDELPPVQKLFSVPPPSIGVLSSFLAPTYSYISSFCLHVNSISRSHMLAGKIIPLQSPSGNCVKPGGRGVPGADGSTRAVPGAWELTPAPLWSKREREKRGNVMVWWLQPSTAVQIVCTCQCQDLLCPDSFSAPDSLQLAPSRLFCPSMTLCSLSGADFRRATFWRGHVLS